jgi:protein involved in polysaccharide export with SLBB domain
MKNIIKASCLCCLFLLPWAVFGSDSRLGVDLRIEKLERITEISDGKVRVLGLVQLPGEYDIEQEMTVLSAVTVAGGLKGKSLVGKDVVIVSPSRGYRLQYSGISGSYNREEWKEFYGTILIAEGDTIYIEERVL